ncbi:MAG: acetyl-CoA hydrolase/transferase C-terminal domain-containing protein [Hyphomicrobiaceae bacterium]
MTTSPPSSADSPLIADLVQPGDTLMWGMGQSEPIALLERLNGEIERLPSPCRAILGLTLTRTLDARRFSEKVAVRAFGGAGTNRRFQDLGNLDALPMNYSAIPKAIRSGALRVDVALATLAADGASFNLGPIADYIADAVATARVVIAEINDALPITYGDTEVSPSRITRKIEVSHPPVEMSVPPPGAIDREIGRLIARLVPDGATLEVGLGVIPDAALAALAGKRDLGIHSGTIGDGVVALVEAGAVTNARKPVDTGLTVSAGVLGTHRAYRWAHRNERLRVRSPSHTHNVAVMASIPHFIGINTALEVDLTGQMNAETAGGRSIGMIGGHADFMRGCQLSEGGIGIVALPSTAKDGRLSRIVARLGDGVVTTARGDADVVVTEHGIAELKGRSVHERAKALIAVAHPDFRRELEVAAERLV